MSLKAVKKTTMSPSISPAILLYYKLRWDEGKKVSYNKFELKYLREQKFAKYV